MRLSSVRDGPGLYFCRMGIEIVASIVTERAHLGDGMVTLICISHFPRDDDKVTLACPSHFDVGMAKQTWIFHVVLQHCRVVEEGI